MGAPNQVIVFVFFGEKYMEQFRVCAQTLQLKWEVKVITDTEASLPNNCEIIKIETPRTVYEMLTYRGRLHQHVDINKYDRIWYADCDILFKGDITERYKDSDRIMVSNEPFTGMDNEHMNGALTTEEKEKLILWRAPAINGGFYSVPKNHYSFFESYRIGLEAYSEDFPNQKATDQFILNAQYHRHGDKFRLFEAGDVGFYRQEDDRFRGRYLDHFIGMHLEKTELMRRELARYEK